MNSATSFQEVEPVDSAQKFEEAEPANAVAKETPKATITSFQAELVVCDSDPEVAQGVETLRGV